VVVGFQGHVGGAFGFVRYFVADGKPLTDSVGMGNWTGLAATVILALLLVLSTDRYLRELKAKPWKDLQRLNYALFALVVLHAVFYGALRRITSPFTRLLVGSTVAVLIAQLAGVYLYRLNSRSRTSTRHATEAGADANDQGTCHRRARSQSSRRMARFPPQGQTTSRRVVASHPAAAAAAAYNASSTAPSAGANSVPGS